MTVPAPQERYLLGPLQRVARFSMRHAKPVVVATIVLMAIGLAAGTALAARRHEPHQLLRQATIRCTSRRPSSTRSCPASTASTSCSKGRRTR